MEKFILQLFKNTWPVRAFFLFFFCHKNDKIVACVQTLFNIWICSCLPSLILGSVRPHRSVSYHCDGLSGCLEGSKCESTRAPVFLPMSCYARPILFNNLAGIFSIQTLFLTNLFLLFKKHKMSNEKNSSYSDILADILEWKKGLPASCFWFVPA